jgi:hypothetical protein
MTIPPISLTGISESFSEPETNINFKGSDIIIGRGNSLNAAPTANDLNGLVGAGSGNILQLGIIGFVALIALKMMRK